MNPVKTLTDSIQPMTVTPETIGYDLFETSLGLLLVAVTDVGPCLVTFVEGGESAQAALAERFSGSQFVRCYTNETQAQRAGQAANRGGFAEKIKAVQTRLLGGGLLDATPLTFHLKGTDFQLRVWQELVTVPWGETTTYALLAERMGQPAAFRAVGNAVGDNPIFCLIPCHRVVKSDGTVGNYRWGKEMKQLLLEAEGVDIP